jgi:hypothetical protein
VSWRADRALAAWRWRGKIERYDLIKEGLVAFVIVGIVLVVLTTLFGSPKLAGVSIKTWAENAPKDFTATALTELVGTSESAGYGPPYNNPDLGCCGNGQLQYLGPFSIQKILGVTIPVNATEDLFMKPLRAIAVVSPGAKGALDQWSSATAEQRTAWSNAAQKATLSIEGATVKLDGGDSGPIPAMLTEMLAGARAGIVDSQLIDRPGSLYSMDYTKVLLYLGDGNYINEVGAKYTLGGQKWGVTNEIGSWPGQPWLWVYSLFYQIPPWVNYSQGSDIIVIATVTVIFLAFLLLPLIPGLRDIPRWIGAYRLIWRDYYRASGSTPAEETYAKWKENRWSAESPSQSYAAPKEDAAR